MTPHPSERARHILAAALDHDAEEREPFLAIACENDASLLVEVRALLQAHEAMPPGFLNALPARPFDTTIKGVLGMRLPAAELVSPERPGEMVGPYKLREKIGEGGFGTVWVAEQEQPVRRRVALKIIKLGMDTLEVVARFNQERQALAMMDHPNIAKVLDVGATERGRPFFVMELVRGITITDYCDQNSLPTPKRVALLISVCQAVQHAHQKGIIHRDLKPSNILVTLHDGEPVPKVIDFGIAKATEGRLIDATIYTQLHQFVGTPAYMSPEQAEMSGLDIDTRSDIYSLGVLLYELLTGHTPFDTQELMSRGLEAMRRTIREKEPVRPSTKVATLQADELTTTARRRSAETSKLLNQLRGDLDWIVMKCLDKDRTRRYETASALAADLKRHLENEPVVACPPSVGYKLRKAFRRNKIAFTSAALVALALIFGVVGTTLGLLRAERERRAAEAAQKIAEHRLRSAMQFVDDVFTKVSPRFADLIGASKARADLARTSLTFIESLADPAQGDDAFRAQLAKLYANLADSLGDSIAANSLGDYDTALQLSKQSLALWEDLLHKNPADVECQRRVAGLELQVGGILEEFGDFDAALPHYRRSLQTQEALAVAHPDDARHSDNIGITHWWIGYALLRQGRTREALEEHYLPYSGKWLDRPLDKSAEFRDAHDCYVAHGLVGEALLELGRAKEALAHFERSFEWVKLKVEMQPDNARSARDWCEILRFTGRAQTALGQTEEGTQSLEEAVRRAASLVERDPTNAQFQLELVDCLQFQAESFAAIAHLPGHDLGQQAEHLQRAKQALSKVRERLDALTLHANKLSLKRKAERATKATTEVQLALEKLAAHETR